jgi:ribokinase
VTGIENARGPADGPGGGPRIVVLGDVMVDVVAHLDGPVAPGSDAPARIAFRGGGSAANVAAWLAAAGIRPALVARVGEDERGRSAAAELRAAGVDTRLTADPERPTGTCVVLVAPGGERTMIPDAAAGDSLAPADLPDELLAPGRHLHVAGYALLRGGSRAAARAAIERARARGMSVSLDPSSAALLSPAFLDLTPGTDLLLPNASEATALTGESDPERAGRRLAGSVPEVVVKLGELGALWTDGRETRRVDAAAVPTPVDTTGAGDAFAAGLLAARLEGASPEEALAAGCRLAAEAVGMLGARPVAQGAANRSA